MGRARAKLMMANELRMISIHCAKGSDYTARTPAWTLLQATLFSLAASPYDVAFPAATTSS
jgi:hypothetical protein